MRGKGPNFMRSLFLAGILAGGMAAAAWGEEAPVAAGSTSEQILKPVSELVAVFNKLNLPLNAQEASKAVAEALARTADPASRIMTDEEIARMQARQRGVVYEAPLSFISTNGLPVVTEVVPDSPAAQAGLQVGDRVEEIDGEALLSNMSPMSVTSLLRSDTATPALLRVRGADDKSREVQLPREERRLPAVDKAEDWPVSFCYLKLNGIYEGAGEAAASNLLVWSEAGRFGVIIDLRGAGGANLDSAGQVAGLFADPGAVLFTLRDSQNQDLQVVKNTSRAQVGMPAMVLVDDETTGAAEVLAATLAASVRGAMLLGQPTAGDPMLREVVDLPTGDKLYVATRRLVMANGRTYDGREGVVPAVEVAEVLNTVDEYEPPEPLLGGKELSEEEKEDRQLRERVRGDATLRRAVDVLLGLKALNIRGFGTSETRAD